MSEPQRPSRNPSPARAGGWSLRVGSALGIPIRIHFTFLLLLLQQQPRIWAAAEALALV